MSHSFTEKTFGHLTYCGVCKQLLWGVIKQGLECKECHYACHRKCKTSASKCPNAVPTKFLDDTSTKDSPAEKYLRQLQQKNETISPSSSSSTTSSINPQPTKETTYQHLSAIATSDKFHNILADAVTNQDEPVNAYLANQPPLNPQLTTKNFSRFVSRCGPVFEFRDRLILLLSWKNPVDTLVSLIMYCIICLYPKLLLFIPQTVLVYFIMSNYFKSNKKTSTTTKEKKSSPKLTEKVKNIAKPSTSTSSQKKSSEEVKRNLPDSLLSFGFSTLFQPASDESPEYLKNLQNIQNSMGEFSDLYDWIMSQSTHINWSSESRTLNILQAILFLTSVFGLVVYFVPLNMIFLSTGLMIYATNTRFAKYLFRELQPYIIESFKSRATNLKEWYVKVENKHDSLDQIKEISVYENQRWWPLSGYIHKLIEVERSPWSDFTGKINLPTTAEVTAPEGYKWKEASEWKLDMSGPWVDDYLEIEVRIILKLQLISVAPTQNGWIYSDDNWNITTPQITPVENIEEKQNEATKTRRRRWIRECERLES